MIRYLSICIVGMAGCGNTIAIDAYRRGSDVQDVSMANTHATAVGYLFNATELLVKQAATEMDATNRDAMIGEYLAAAKSSLAELNGWHEQHIRAGGLMDATVLPVVKRSQGFWLNLKETLGEKQSKTEAKTAAGGSPGRPPPSH